MSPPQVFRAGVHAINVGLAAFTEPPRTHGATVTQLAWRPEPDVWSVKYVVDPLFIAEPQYWLHLLVSSKTR